MAINLASAATNVGLKPRGRIAAGTCFALHDRMDLLVLFAVLGIPPVLVSVVRGTRLFWLPGVALFGVAILAFASMSDAHGEAGVMR